MTKVKDKLPTVFIVVGVVLLALVLVAGGMSAIFTPKADGAEALEKAAAHDGVYRPYVAVDFDYVAFSGLYLTGDNDDIEVWVMWGFTADAVTCFYQRADGRDIDGDGRFDEDDAPADAYDINYILRAPEPAYAEHNDWALSESRGDTAKYYGLTEEESNELFSDGVLSAARKDRMIAQIALVAGVLSLAVGIVLFVLQQKKRAEETEYGEHEFYVPPTESDELFHVEHLEDDRVRGEDVPPEGDTAHDEPRRSRPYRLGRDFTSRDRLRLRWHDEDEVE